MAATITPGGPWGRLALCVLLLIAVVNGTLDKVPGTDPIVLPLLYASDVLVAVPTSQKVKAYVDGRDRNSLIVRQHTSSAAFQEQVCF